MTNIEELLLNADCIEADDKYISNGHFIISKKYIQSEALRKLKTVTDIFSHAGCNGTVPFERGGDFPINVGTKCELFPDNTIGICYNERFGFNYEYVKVLTKAIPYWCVTCYYVVENAAKQPILKIFVDDEFVACLMPLDKERCYGKH